ncbi:hypothetical protein EST38_g11280 [Candolleomyces aberdarensis]|uniref:USP domain-containing protein n=1 Tax=Candolleomyces aberdarensis TaxID=2316362 RepID=A0A4Q2D580_9AGAR|nr:hypothetical protein EST38_g11280 [Candolleomyces aberdarensis]
MQLDPASIELLSSLANVEADVARRVLQKHNGNIDEAANALLSGDTGEEPPASTWTQRHNTPERRYYDTDPSISITAPLPGGSQSTIDLTDASTYNTSGTKFGPSNRAPHPEWQMVPSDVAVGGTPGISQEDQSLNDAIQRSLDDFRTEEKETFPLKETLREGNRAEGPSHFVQRYLLSLAQLWWCKRCTLSLKFVSRLGNYDYQISRMIYLSTILVTRRIWNLIELFTNMDLAKLSTIVDVEVLPSLEDEENRDRGNEHPTDRATSIIANLARIIEAHLAAQEDDDEPQSVLFEFKHVNVTLSNRLPRKVGRIDRGGVVRVDYGGEESERDLISCLASVLSSYEEVRSQHDVILDPAEFLAFALNRNPSATNTPKSEQDIFTFPKSFYLDRFLFENLELVNEKMLEGRAIAEEISELSNRKTTMSRLNQRDTVQDIKNSIYYYENIARAKSDEPERQQVIKETTAQLQDILLMLESKIEGLNRRTKELEAKSATLFDCPELKQHPYDLRAVLMHTGLPGRKQLYSYVRDAEGKWWKTCDHEVTEVSEKTVLTDTTGVHLSAGPFMLLYSKRLSDEELRRPVDWPSVFADSVEENNKRFLAMLEQEEATPTATAPSNSNIGYSAAFNPVFSTT